MFRYRFALKPGTLANFISKKTRVEFVDLPKVFCEQTVFSAPRQLMIVVECREVIINYINKKRSVISALLFKFLLQRASRHHVSVWPRCPGFRRVLVQPDLSALRGSFCVVVQALVRNKPEHIWLGERENMDHFVTEVTSAIDH